MLWISSLLVADIPPSLTLSCFLYWNVDGKWGIIAQNREGEPPRRAINTGIHRCSILKVHLRRSYCRIIDKVGFFPFKSRKEPKNFRLLQNNKEKKRCRFAPEGSIILWAITVCFSNPDFGVEAKMFLTGTQRDYAISKLICCLSRNTISRIFDILTLKLQNLCHIFWFRQENYAHLR